MQPEYNKNRPLALDLFAGLGGWAEGLLAAGWEVIGIDFDTRFIGRYPAHLVIHDVLNLCARKMRGQVQLVVASPDCREPSYRAMPWKRAKALNAEGPPHKFIELFGACFRIAEEIGCPVIVENVKGAQPWVGRAAWHYGSFYLWGDVPALMPIPRSMEMGRAPLAPNGKTRRLTNPTEWRDGDVYEYGIKRMSGLRGFSHPSGNGGRDLGGPNDPRRFSSRSAARREASAQIAKIPFDLAYHIGKTFLPTPETKPLGEASIEPVSTLQPLATASRRDVFHG